MRVLSYETLKFYCNKGLIPNVKRDANGRRYFDEYDVRWIKDLTCLKKCDMSIQEMREYLELCLKGKESIEERKMILEKKKTALEKEIRERKESIAYVNCSILR